MAFIWILDFYRGVVFCVVFFVFCLTMITSMAGKSSILGGCNIVTKVFMSLHLLLFCRRMGGIGGSARAARSVPRPHAAGFLLYVFLPTTRGQVREPVVERRKKGVCPDVPPDVLGMYL
jgi:hypothetical protein